MLNIFSSFYHQKHFNVERWKDKPSLRYEMTDEIINKNILIGKTKLEIEAILGKSEWNSWDETLKAHSPDIWHYNLGFKPGAFNKQQETMEILFSKDSLKTVRQYQTEHTFE
ncbi:hypothetical protein ACFFU9_15595 [Mariniflexile ostreae]|uniref:Uncharacterized protein n=1 Tax=Mariniflexile ostreae TaxID=1520892 RepID=A0ABV5FFD7_9FLAO